MATVAHHTGYSCNAQWLQLQYSVATVAILSGYTTPDLQYSKRVCLPTQRSLWFRVCSAILKFDLYEERSWASAVGEVSSRHYNSSTLRLALRLGIRSGIRLVGWLWCECHLLCGAGESLCCRSAPCSTGHCVCGT